MNKTVFLDRDGTIIFDKHYLSAPDGVELLPSAAVGLQRMAQAGYSLVIVSNQSGIGRGYFSEADLQACSERLQELLQPYGVSFKAVLFCPHAPDEQCSCRKPATGMITESGIEYDPADSFVIGDKACDIKLGQNLALQTILVRTGKGAKEEEKQTCRPDYVADELLDAAEYILNKG